MPDRVRVASALASGDYSRYESLFGNLKSVLVSGCVMAKVFGAFVLALLAASASAARADEGGRWRQIENRAEPCEVWSEFPKENETVTWSGPCVDGKAEGQGEEVWRYLIFWEWEERTFSGGMKGGKRHGHGVAAWPYGERYEGEFWNGKYHGRGVLLLADGAKYEGEFWSGEFHGRGVLLLADGDSYEGEFWHDKPNGEGTASIGGDVYRGKWTYGCFDEGYRQAWITVSQAVCGF